MSSQNLEAKKQDFCITPVVHINKWNGITEFAAEWIDQLMEPWFSGLERSINQVIVCRPVNEMVEF